MADRLRFYGGDFLADPLPEADVVVTGPDAQRRELLRRIHGALRPGGALMIYDLMADPESESVHDVLQRLNHGLIRGDSSSCTLAECHASVEEAGFEVTRTEQLDNLLGDWLIVATKR
ncbi:hypothetical protein ADK38_27580 [Streptomyces varsoviensis]|uniref:O-methyltransferase C-terminal domain-containing protein n=1 Tax=Streptomyces varsoviensis TaxID=67373 RepID=A0ABR5J0W5_9ACTN|nr:hypothetical protein ADK38_27580 [Streptomyces varsoviensis]